jgi:integrase
VTFRHVNEGHWSPRWISSSRVFRTGGGNDFDIDVVGVLVNGDLLREIVQMILGHSSPEVTRKVYAHLMRKAAAEQVETATELLTKHGASGVLVPA